ncbi:MAG TPA: phosphate ABC transporter ATP-binding protein [Aminobacterium sp.]|nr:phosphate ABC transporter ATP-binding protein [Aminobacterium sp.]
MDPILETRNLSVSFGGKVILKGINVSIPPRQITAIIGPSGCGKSTFLKSLNRLISEEEDAIIEGHVLLDGENILSLQPEKVRQRIGMVFQAPTPFPLSIFDNMAYPLRYYGYKKENIHTIIIEKLKIAGLYEEVQNNLSMKATLLSGGQQQRLCIARALTVEPEILLLDEPCSALDIKNTLNIETMLAKLCEHYTIIIVTHNLFQARRLAHKTLFMLDGEIVEEGCTSTIFSQPQDERTAEYTSGIYG